MVLFQHISDLFRHAFVFVRKRLAHPALAAAHTSAVQKLAPQKCSGCGAIHRELGGLFFPYKQYEAEVIFGVLEGLITCETLGFEDYPCEMTMLRWLSQKAQLLLWRNP